METVLPDSPGQDGHEYAWHARRQEHKYEQPDETLMIRKEVSNANSSAFALIAVANGGVYVYAKGHGFSARDNGQELTLDSVADYRV